MDFCEFSMLSEISLKDCLWSVVRQAQEEDAYFFGGLFELVVSLPGGPHHLGPNRFQRMNEYYR
jgi:hypothetical protein